MHPILPTSYCERVGDVLVRPMTEGDLAAVEEVSDLAFYEADLVTHRRGWPDPHRRTADHSAGWIRRTGYFLTTDPGGCWVAEDDGEVVAVATSLRRETLWVLATYAVRPGLQGRGIGKQVLEAALTHSQGCLRGMLAASSDPRAVRRYLLAGFTMHPQMFLQGTVDRTAIPPGTGEKVREGTDADRELMDSIDRRLRGAGHGPDHEFLLREQRLYVSDTTTGSGYAYTDHRGIPWLLAATNRRTAARLLWTVLADGPEEITVGHVTAANAWAVDVGTEARLELHQEGYLALRGMDPPSPYLHHGAML